ncbi:MAG: polysaccharide biosynthesis/export family protein [Candidatus Omnitrophica bacterium]|nr:polysaccharide biosynthesis/export family protein [Candidatus Omnitrophota bacterium]
MFKSSFKHNFFFLYFFSLIFFLSPLYSQDKEKALHHFRLGEVYYEHGMYKEAEAEFKKSLKILNYQEKESPPEIDKEQQSPQIEYRISQGDTLSISVWENNDLDQKVIVRPDGKISFPLIDEIDAKGMTISQLDKEITSRLKEYIRFPDVSISLIGIGGSKIMVLGEVVEPGVYTISGRKTVLEAIAMAQGFTSDAVASSVIVVQGGLDNPQASRLNLTQALHNPSSQQNIVLESENIVFVPKKFIANVRYFLTQFMQPFSTGASTYSSYGRTGAHIY